MPKNKVRETAFAWLVYLAGLGLCLFVLFISPRRQVVQLGELIELANQELFLPEILEKPSSQEQLFQCEELLVAGLGPHHLPFGAELLQDVYQTLATCRPDVNLIVLLSPDHFQTYPQHLITADLRFKTSLGVVQTDMDFLAKLAGGPWQSRLVFDPKPFYEEHGIQAHLPFIQKYYPQAQLVPILVGERVSKQTAIELGRFLADSLPAQGLLVLSLDLSHYQDVATARSEDDKTIIILERVDSSDLSQLKADSPLGVLALFSYLDALGVDSGQVLGRANSADFGADSRSTTGYAGLVY